MTSARTGNNSLGRYLRATTALASFAGVLIALPLEALAGPDACFTVGSVSTCTDDQSDGIIYNVDFPGSSTVLNVNNLDSDIAPAADVNGIVFVGETTVEINSELGNRDIILNGFAEGVIGAAPGDVEINHEGDIRGGFRGVNGNSDNGNVVINVQGDIKGSDEAAINAYAPNGTITIDYEGDIKNADNRGIGAFGKGDIEIRQDGDIESVNQAIYARSTEGSIYIDSDGDIDTSSGDGVSAESTGVGDTVTVIRKGDTIAEDRAIWANGYGDVLINSDGKVVSRGINAIYALSLEGKATIISDGDVTAENQAIFAQGDLDTSITSKGDVTAKGNDAIFAQSQGGGNASVNSEGDVKAGNRGILAFSTDTDGGNVSIVSKGDVTANGDAIYAFTRKGDAYVRQRGDVTAVLDSGIRANTLGDGKATIDSKGDVKARLFGLDAMVLGNGDINITHEGDVTSSEDHGVKAYIQGNGNVTINTTGNIEAQNMGIQAQTNGTGNTAITHRGNVTSSDDIGVYAFGDGNIGIDVEGEVQAGNIGIYARSTLSNKAVTIKSRGNVTSETNNAIMAEASGGGSTVSIDSKGDLIAGDTNRGISAIADGDVDVTSKGDVTSTDGLYSGEGIYALSQNGASSVISEGNIDAGNQGIFAIGRTGASIDSTGNVTAAGNDAIFAFNQGGSSGDATVKSVGDVETGGRGIVAISQTGAASVDSKGTVNARLTGVSVYAGDGNATIKQIGDVTSEDAGVTAYSENGNAGVTVKGNVDARINGVVAQVQSGGGTATVNVEGDVTSELGQGIVGFSNGAGDVSIVSNGTVKAYSEGLVAVGAGNVSIDQTGDVTSSQTNGLTADTTGGNVSIKIEGNVEASDAAIQGITDGANKSVQITSRGNLNATRGIIGEATASNSTVLIDSKGNIDVEDVGIQALASGNATILSTGNVYSEYNRGMQAISGDGAASVTSSGNVDSSDMGIFAKGDTGANIESNGDVTSRDNTGIQAQTASGAATIVSKGNVTTDDKGIFAYTNNGSASVSSQGDVYSRNEALSALANGGTASVFSRGNVTSENLYGIQASGVGTVNVDSIGVINANQQGILALGTSSGTTVTVLQSGDVTSDNSKGVEAIGHGNVNVTVSGAIDANHEGILAVSSNGNATVHQTGNVFSDSSKGVSAFAYGSAGIASATVIGNVEAQHEGILAIGNGAANIYARGNVTSDSAIGISAIATSSGGTVSIDAAGDVSARQSGIFGYADETVQITYSGNATSEDADAIFGMSQSGGVTINSSGSATGNTSTSGDRNGIFALGEDNVSVTHVGDATTLSDGRAIHAQSNNGNVLVDVTGNITVNADYDDSDAIFVLATNGMADVLVRKGSVVTGGQKALASFGVEFGTGTGPNSLQNYGLIDDANGGKTIGGGDADEIVSNYGVVDGDFYLGGGANRFDNNEGGQTWLKAFSSVGSGNDFNNWGELSPFGVGEVGLSVLEGNYNQSGSGVFIADIDLDASTSDYLDTTGDVNAGGKVRANLTSLSTNLAPYSATIIYSNGTVFDNGISGITTGPLAVDVTTTSTTVDISVAIDFAANGKLDGNEEALGKGFQKYYENSAPGGLTPEQEEFYLALLNSNSLGEYKDALAGLSPEAAGAGILATMYGAENFAGRLFSCHQRDGVYRYIAEGSCAWAAASGSVWDHDGDDGFADYTDRSTWLSAGAQAKADSGWVFGFGVGYEWGETEVDPSADLDREMFSGGVVAKYQQENWLFGAALSGGTGTIDSTRNVTIPSNETATGDRSVSYGDLTARIAYLMDYNSFYIKPMLEGAMTFVSAGGYTESGAGVANVTVEGDNYFTGRGTASVELGTEIVGADGMLVRPTVVAGVTVLTDGDIDVEAGFGNLGPQNITVVSERDQVALDLGAGIEVLGGSGWTGQIAYDGRFSGSDEQHALTLKLSMPF